MPPVIEIPSSYSEYLTFKALRPSPIASNLSDSFTLNSLASEIFVIPSAQAAAILKIGISSIILGIMSPPIFMPLNCDDLTIKSPAFSPIIHLYCFRN